MGHVKSKSGGSLTESAKMKERWREYTETLYQLDANLTQVYNEQSFTMAPIVLQSEVRKAMKELSCGKSPGGNEIPIERIKNSGEEGVAAKTVLYNRAQGLEKIHIYSDTQKMRYKPMREQSYHCANITCQQNPSNHTSSNGTICTIKEQGSGKKDDHCVRDVVLETYAEDPLDSKAYKCVSIEAIRRRANAEIQDPFGDWHI